jgi:hypothetical protein
VSEAYPGHPRLVWRCLASLPNLPCAVRAGMEPRWVAPDGVDAGSRLLLLYQILALIVLLVGLAVNCRLMVNWNRLLPELNNVTYSFLWISVADCVTLAIWIPTAFYYIITWEKPIGEAGSAGARGWPPNKKRESIRPLLPSRGVVVCPGRIERDKAAASSNGRTGLVMASICSYRASRHSSDQMPIS